MSAGDLDLGIRCESWAGGFLEWWRLQREDGNVSQETTGLIQEPRANLIFRFLQERAGVQIYANGGLRNLSLCIGVP